MPKYSYKCTSCEESFEQTHSIKIKLTDCESCLSEGTLKRIPSNFISLKLGAPTGPGKQKTGEVTKAFIEDARESLQRDKKNIKNKDYVKK